MKNKKRIVIHVGPGKTGSSALQAWLCNNQNLLSKNGIFYPEHKLNKHSISSGHCHELLSFVDGKWVVDKEKIHELISLFNNRKEHTLLLSSEFFFHSIRQLNKVLPEAEFILYIRNPVELLESHYNQGIKRHSHTEKFKAPELIGDYFWKYLDDVFKTVPHKQILLKPYHNELFLNGSIIEDLLSHFDFNSKLMGSNFKNNINRSYSFSVLEYKRLVNYFPLAALEPELDLALQDCQLGLQSYSLMTATAYDKLSAENLNLLSVFIEKHQQNQLIPLLDKLTLTKQKQTVTHEGISLEQLKEVNDFLRDKNYSVYCQVKELICTHNNLVVDNNIIYSVFDCEYSPLIVSELEEKSLAKVANHLPIHHANKPKVMHDIAEHFFSVNDFEKAVIFSKVAYEMHDCEKHRNQFNKYIVSFNCGRSITKSNKKETKDKSFIRKLFFR